MHTQKTALRAHHLKKYSIYGVVFVLLVGIAAVFSVFIPKQFHFNANGALADVAITTPPVAVLDTIAYDKKLLAIANYPPPRITASSTATSTLVTASTTAKRLWPAKNAPYPNAGALLPFNRIVAYYGNFYSKGMGVLGKYPEAEMLTRLKAEVAAWSAADPSTPVIPGIDYITVTAQGSKGVDGKYRLRMPDSQIDHALDLAKQLNGIVILDVQVGFSTLQQELPLLQKYLSMPNVHLAIDPEFSMKHGIRPGKEIGTFDAADINYAANYLATLVKANNLPPKMLVVHRFTEEMVTHYKNITPLSEVQIVMDMDGWGFPAKKLNTYNSVIYPEPVEFTGFKLFYKNDLLPPSTRMLSYAEVLKLIPQPVFIQYQ